MLLARTKTTRRAEIKGDMLRMLFTAAKIMEKICSQNAGTLHAIYLQFIHDAASVLSLRRYYQYLTWTLLTSKPDFLICSRMRFAFYSSHLSSDLKSFEPAFLMNEISPMIC
jgi:hypothetical protein